MGSNIPPKWVAWFIGLNAAVGLGAGIALLVLPDVFLRALGVSTDPTGTLVARLFGADLLGFNVTTSLVLDIRPVPRSVVVGHTANESLSALILLAAAASGVGNVLVPALGIVALAFAGGYVWLAVWGDPG